jgi:TIR domain
MADEYDVFLSYSSADKPAVEAIALRLRDEAGLRPFLDAWHLVPGDPWMTALERAIERSAAVAVFLGPKGMGPWHEQESQLALVTGAQRRGKRVIPILLPGTRKEDLDGFLSLRTWVELAEGNGFAALVAGITGRAPGPTATGSKPGARPDAEAAGKEAAGTDQANSLEIEIPIYDLTARRQPNPARLPPRRRGASIKKLSDLDVSWDRYYAILLAQGNRPSIRLIPTKGDDNAYLTELRRCRSAFAQYRSLARMPLVTRQVVAGFGESQGWFGRTFSAGYYKKLINTASLELSEALDEIPTDDDITDEALVRISERAFALRGVGLACWTRLLSMKRPDLFLCVNSANKNRVRQIFDAAPDSARTYLTFTRRILAFPWASATTPGDEAERELWEGRVALLDAILYEPS